MDIDEDMSPREVAALGLRLFGPRYNCFFQLGNMHVGRFLDDGRYRRGPNQGREMSPWHRKQEIFGVGKTWREAFRFATGRSRIYSGGGMGARHNSEGTGYTPVFDKFGRPVGFKSPGGIFHKTFPSDVILTA